ncbi:head maturation protease, ClpP-related [Shinella zoogloeoides]|uniref:head maturation protease, ClpP-related n=1 Tax=Shinella zoogloeoides TaxID=352475 RepID=UPI00273CF55F|nr:head maturation protease, ClpP-related [Shinella zoogloeoides]WLR92934.1 Clp protease ClpP [Shinella zoogloeoides]
MAAILEDGKLRLSGYVGDYYFSDGFTSSDVVVALASIDDGDDLTVHINSGGGVATEGAAIHALLSARKGVTDVVIEGIAASAASLIAMAGATVTMSAGAVMMIHDPSGYTFGTSDDHSKTIEGLEALATAYARVYAQKSGKTAEECREIMKDERWLTPEQAVAEGFADETTEAKALAVAAFDYRLYAHAPKRLTALAVKKDWSAAPADRKAAPSAASTRQPQETSMTEKTKADEMTAAVAQAKADAAARIKAIMTSPEANGREQQAEHLAYETDMAADAAVKILATAPQGAAAADEPAADDDTPDPKTYEASRIAGAGLGGKTKTQQPQASGSLVANMRKLLGKEAV